MPRLTQYRRLVLGIFCAVITGLLLFGYFVESLLIIQFSKPPLFLLRAEDYLKDSFEIHGRKTAPNPNLAFIGIDQLSVNLDGVSEDEFASSPVFGKMKEGWPWERSVHAMILDRLANAGAKVVVFDLLFPGPRPGDESFKEAIERWGDKIVLASNFDYDPAHRDLRAIPLFPSPSLLPTDSPQKAKVGYVNYFPDADGVVRRTHCYLLPEAFGRGAVDQDSIAPDSLATAALRQFGRPDLIPKETPVAVRFTGETGTFTAHPAYELFVPTMWKQNYADGEFFRDKVVIVGPSGGFLQDEHRVAVDKSMPGPEIHLNVFNALLHREFLHETPFKIDIVLIALAGFAAWLIGILVHQPAIRLAVLAAVSASAMALLWLLYNRTGFLTTMATPMLALNGAGGVCLVFDFVLERMEKGRFRRTLERYVSKNIVKEILDNPTSYINTLGGMRRPVAVLFTDLRGFTARTEAADSVQLVAQLNEYFTEMVKPVFANDGTLDKFIGDAIMAVWGNVTTHDAKHDVDLAVKTALEMKAALPVLNEKWRAINIPPFAMGIGVNYGTAIAGEIGSPQKMDVTVIGDAVNLASRIEGLTKKYHVDILIGEDAAAHVRDLFHLQSVDLVRVQGKTKPVKVSTIHGAKSEPLSEMMDSYLERFEAGIEDYWARRFEASKGAFEECLRLRPNDFLAEMYQTRCVQLLETPPDEAWNGVIMTEK